MILNVTNAGELCKQAKVNSWCLLDIKNQPVRLTYAETSKGDGLRISKLPSQTANRNPAKSQTGNTVDGRRQGCRISANRNDRKTTRVVHISGSEMERKLLMEKCDGLKKGKEEK